MGAESEGVLANLCLRSFLSLWSCPNPYNDKGLSQRGEGKELCDLLVIFGNDVIIFSDKSCAYPDSGNEVLDWNRWYKRAVLASISQISGAERWLREHPTRVFADNRCTKMLAPKIPARSQMRVHRIVVALGARERCQRYFGGGSGSLPIKGGGPANLRSDDRPPFTLGDEGVAGKFVHAFDDVALSFVLRELDTVADFTTYLSKKEQLFATHSVYATGEEDLLSHYQLTMVGEEHDFLPADAEDASVLAIGESSRPSLTDLPQYKASKLANKDSYVWDRLIEHFTSRWRSQRLQQEITRDRFESALRIMAEPNRIVRRQLGRMILSALADTPPNGIRHKAVLDKRGNTAFALICMSHPGTLSEAEYRYFRRERMALFSRAIRVRHETVKRVLVVGIHSAHDSNCYEDLAIADFSDWTPELDAQTREEMAKAGIRAEAAQFQDHEFPISAQPGSREAARRRKQLERKKAQRSNLDEENKDAQPD